MTEPAAVTGAVSGQVTDERDLPLANVWVSAHTPGGEFLGSALSDESGRFRVPCLRPGPCLVRFIPGGEYVGQWWNGSHKMESAKTVDVIAYSTVAGIDARLGLGCSISGRITAAGSALPLRGVCVSVSSAAGIWGITTDQEGQYRLAGLPADRYKVCFRISNSEAEEWWNGARDETDATVIDVRAGEAVAGIDAQLSPARLLSSTGAPKRYHRPGFEDWTRAG